MKRKYMALAAACLCLSVGCCSLSSRAYTEEEKQMVKEMLIQYGYSPDMAGAQEAYQDYLDGKYNDICEQYGLPKQNVSDAQPGTEPEVSGTGDSSENGEGDSSDGNTAAQSQTWVIEKGEPVEEDDGRIHFWQTRIQEDLYEVTLMEIWTDEELLPPILKEDSEGYTCEEDLVYVDLVFRVKNPGAEDLDVRELIQIAVSDGLADYQEELVLKETENGSVLSEEAVLEAEEEGIFHFGLPVSTERGSFTGSVTLNGETYKLFFGLDSHPKEREKLETEKPLEAETFGILTYGGRTGELDEVMELSLKLQNTSGEELETSEMAAVMAVEEEKILRIPLEGETILDGESKEISVSFELPEEWEKEETEILVYWQGCWYQAE